MNQVTFDPNTRSGKIITNMSIVPKRAIDSALHIIHDAIESGLAVCPLLKLEDLGSHYRIYTSCSMTMVAVLLKRGIPIKPRGGGIIEVVDRQTVRFTDMIMYWAATIDPIDILIAQELTDIDGMMKTGNGRILGNLHEAPMFAMSHIEEVLEELSKAEFYGVLELGEPNIDVLGISVERDHIGIALVGGTNLTAAVLERGVDIKTESISGLTDIKEMVHVNEIV